MPAMDSRVHQTFKYWNVRYDRENGWEASHIHLSQANREIQIYTETLGIRHIDGKFTPQELQEIILIASLYSYDDSIREEYCDATKKLIFKKTK